MTAYDRLDYVIDCWVLGSADVGLMRSVAKALMDDGIVTDAVFEVCEATGNDEASNAFGRLAKEMGWVLPDERTAARRLACAEVCSIIGGADIEEITVYTFTEGPVRSVVADDELVRLRGLCLQWADFLSDERIEYYGSTKCAAIVEETKKDILGELRRIRSLLCGAEVPAAGPYR